jgi:dimethylargininase
VPGALHLKTAVTALPDGTLVADPSRVDLSAFGDRTLIEVDADEPDGANVLALGGVVLISAAAPRTARRVAAAGHAVRLVDISELHRAEAGLTCLSIIDPRRS